MLTRDSSGMSSTMTNAGGNVVGDDGMEVMVDLDGDADPAPKSRWHLTGESVILSRSRGTATACQLCGTRIVILRPMTCRTLNNIHPDRR